MAKNRSGDPRKRGPAKDPLRDFAASDLCWCESGEMHQHCHGRRDWSYPGEPLPPDPADGVYLSPTMTLAHDAMTNLATVQGAVPIPLVDQRERPQSRPIVLTEAVERLSAAEARSASSLSELATMVERTMSRKKDGEAPDVPKTEKSARQIALPTQTVALLVDWRNRARTEGAAAGAVWELDGLVFARSTGEPLSGTQVQYAWKKFCKSAGLPVVRFHDLRHTFATLHLDIGTDVKVVSGSLGHSRTTTTSDVYQALDMRHQKRAAEALGELLGGDVAGGVAGTESS